MRTHRFVICLIVCLIVSLAACCADAARLKDLCRVQGARHNQLIGYGLVVGLSGTGDSRQTVFTTQAVSAMLNRLGADVPPGAMKVKNVAAVIVTVDLPPYLKPGDRVDALVSSLGDASSLQGGILIQTPLTGADANVYAVAQGSISTGGFSAQSSGSSVTKNHPTAGIISNGALVERAVPTTLVSDSRLVLNLNEPDHVTASRMAAAINAELAVSAARAIDAASISVNVPLEYGARVSELIARLEPIQIIPDAVAKVVVNERTGTVVVGSQVSILPVAVAHAGLTVDIATDSLVSQPAPLSQGETTVVETSGIGVLEPEAMLHEVQGTTVQELVRSLNAIKASPRDIIAILQAIKRSGALQAELEVI